MFATDVLLLAVLVLAAATLYSSVGHGGASAYLAAMAIFGLEPSIMKPTALTLNVFVAAIATVRFYRARCFSMQLLLPFIIASIPLAFLGGWMEVNDVIYKRILGVVLIFAAGNLFYQTLEKEERGRKHLPVRVPPIWVALVCGALIGWLSGLIGVGGGIFLSPLIIIAGWADARHTAGVSAAFILVNSIAGLFGHLSGFNTLPNGLPLWVIAAVVGGVIGSGLGARQFGNVGIRRMLALVLLVAAFKMLVTD